MGKSTSNNEKRKRKKDKLKHKKERKDKKRLAKLECERSEIVLNHAEGRHSLIDNKELDSEVIIKTRKSFKFVRDETFGGGRIKKRGKRNKVTIEDESSRSSSRSSRQTACSQEDADDLCDEETNGNTLLPVKPSTSTPVKSGSKTLGGKVHITLISTDKKRKVRASYGESDKVGDRKEEIKEILKEKGEIVLYKNGKEINESKSFAENGIETDDIIEVRAVVPCSVGGSGNEGRHCVR